MSAIEAMRAWSAAEEDAHAAFATYRATGDRAAYREAFARQASALSAFRAAVKRENLKASIAHHERLAADAREQLAAMETL